MKKKPLIQDILIDAQLLEDSINKLISDYKEKYPEPGVKLLKGSEYKLHVQWDVMAIHELYKNK